MRMGLREANQHFSKAVKQVKAGREVVLTERGRPIAVLKPLRSPSTIDAAIRHLEAVGFPRPAARRTPMPPWKPVRIKGAPLSRTLREERELS